jgi:hypothetical protein
VFALEPNGTPAVSHLGDSASLSARHAASRILSLGVSRTYSIGMYAAGPDLRFGPAPGAHNPVLTSESVTDAVATTVADPFMIRVDGTWHMFFEAVVWRGAALKGEIGHATSRDGLRWAYQGIVLAEPFHLSFPYVFAAGSEVFMIPESWQSGSVRLYRGSPFPTRWTFAGHVLRGPVLLDACPFERDGRWWMPVTTSLDNDCLRLFVAESIIGPWREHPASPLVQGDNEYARAAGRILADGDRLLRFAQDCGPAYGKRVRAFEITRLDEQAYEERELRPEPILRESGVGWNAAGMHQIDPHRVEDGSWLACVDGWADARWPRRMLRGLRRLTRG